MSQDTEEIETLLRIIAAMAMIMTALLLASFIIGVIYLPSLR